MFLKKKKFKTHFCYLLTYLLWYEFVICIYPGHQVDFPLMYSRPNFPTFEPGAGVKYVPEKVLGFAFERA